MSDKLRKLETYVQIGDTVLWYPQGDVTLVAHAAVVVGLGMETAVDLHVMEPKIINRVSVEGSRHVSDESTRSEERMEGGCWKHKPDTIAMRAMLLQHGFLVEENYEFDFAPYAKARAAEREAAEKAAAAAAEAKA